MQLVRFKRLQDDGIINDRMSLARKIEKENFPKPIVLSPNTLAWDYDEVLSWLASRPRRAPKTGKKSRQVPVNASLEAEGA